jgi:mitochondrial fission protein ELM1
MERPALPDESPPAADAHARGVCAVSDGRAGNVRQAEALADALGRESTRHCTLEPRAPWRFVAPVRLPRSDRAFGEHFRSLLAMPPALAIGCGRQAALATRLLRERGAKVVQILDPRIAPRHWDLLVVPQHDAVRGTNVLPLLGSLNPVDDLWLARARADFADFAQLPRPRTAVLLGGSSRHARFDLASFELLATRLDRALASDGGSVLLTASRRTPQALRDALRHRYAETPGIVWLGPQDGPNPYPGLLGWADRIVCSPDSVNMISEACASDVPVFVFEPAQTTGRLRVFLDTLLARGRIHAMDDLLAPFAAEPLRETARIAAEVRARLGR